MKMNVSSLSPVLPIIFFRAHKMILISKKVCKNIFSEKLKFYGINTMQRKTCTRSSGNQKKFSINGVM